MLGAFDIKYMPRTTTKGQVLANSIAEFTKGAEEDKMSGLEILVVFIPYPTLWKIYTYGAANHKGSGVGIVLISLENIIVEKYLRVGFPATNNEAEYEALLAEMMMVSKLRSKAVEIFSDSRLVVGQINGEFEARDQRMQGYLSKVRQAQSDFEVFSIKQILRSQNSHVDSLATLATSLGLGLPQVIIVEDLVALSKYNRAMARYIIYKSV